MWRPGVHDTTCDVEVVELDDAEAADLFDRIARREMGISGAEFLARLDNGDYEDVDHDSVPGLVEVWMSLPFVR
jgi:hypothetical protein